MTVEKTFEVVVGVMVLLSVALTHFVHPGFAWMTVFIGANVIQQAFTGFCPIAAGLRKTGLKTEQDIGAQRAC